MNTNKILSPHHLLSHLKLYMTLSCQIQCQNQFCQSIWKTVCHIDSPQQQQQPPTTRVVSFLSARWTSLFWFELQLTVLPVKMCFKTWYMYYILLLLQVKSSNTGFEQRHNLSLKLNFPFRPVISRRRSRVETQQILVTTQYTRYVLDMQY